MTSESGPERPRLRVELITAENMPPGCESLTLTGPGTQRTVLGRRVTVAVEPPEVVAQHVAECGRELQVVRYPTTGLNLPGEDSPVGVLVWCSWHGEVTAFIDVADEQEKAWGWNTPSQV